MRVAATMSSVGAPQSPALPKGGQAPPCGIGQLSPPGPGPGQGVPAGGQGRQDARWSAAGRSQEAGLVLRATRPQSCARPASEGAGAHARVWHPALRRDRRRCGGGVTEHSGAAARGPACKPGGARGRRVRAASLLPRSSPSAGPPADPDPAALGTFRSIYRAVQASSGAAASGPGPPSWEDGCPPRDPGRPPGAGTARPLLA